MPFEADTLRPGFSGSVLAPWPNRIADGRYAFNGEQHQLALTEPERHNALHGLVAWLEFRPATVDGHSITLEAEIVPQAGYPYAVGLTVRYELSDDGLATTLAAKNIGAEAAPFGAAAHPYLVAGSGRVNDWTLTLPAASVLDVTPDRLLPGGTRDVSTFRGGAFDFRMGRPIGDVAVDHAFTELARNGDGMTTVEIRSDTGTGTGMTWDAGSPWVQIHTADGGGRRGLVVEPMTCPPDAFNSGIDLIVLERGESTSSSWRIFRI
jgi:aldose 1-epimerase